jgi:tetratricopeptide (TPR) repeat protein
MPERNRAWSTALLIAVVCVAFAPAFWAGFVWDDDDYVVENPVLRSLSGLWQIWTQPHALPQYYPLVHTTFWLEYQLFGIAPWPYHTTNIALHAGCAVLVWRFLSRLQVPGALLGALLFAAHPVQVESVAWITERKNVLSLLFALLAAHAWLDYAAAPTRRAFLRTSLWFALALLSKTVVATLPAVMLALTWWRHGRLPRHEVRAALLLLALGAASGLFTAWLERTHVGASGVGLTLAPAERLLVAGRAPWAYAASLVLPWTTCFNYPRWQLDPASLAQWLYPLALLAGPSALWAVRRQVGRGPLAAVLCFVGVLFPALGFVDVYPFRYSFVADHFQYHACIALLALIGAALTRGTRSLPPPMRYGLAGLLVAALCGWSFAHSRSFANFEVLWQHTLACNDASAIAHTNLGKLRMARDPAAAARHLERALQIDPRLDEAHINLGVLAYQRGDKTAAREHFEAARQIAPRKAASYNNLAFLRTEENQHAEALALCEQALALQPDYYDARVTASIALLALGRHAACLEHCEFVLARTPHVLETRERAVDTLLGLCRYDAALEHAIVLMRRPSEPAGGRARFARALAGVVAAGAPGDAAQRVADACAQVPQLRAELLAATGAELLRQGRHDLADRVRSPR